MLAKAIADTNYIRLAVILLAVLLVAGQLAAAQQSSFGLDESSLAFNKQKLCNGNLSFASSTVLFDAKTSTSPVQFVIAKRYYEHGKAVRLKLKTVVGNYSEPPLIRNFFVQAHVDNTSQIVGQFNASFTDHDVTILPCGDFTQFDTAVDNNSTFESRQEVSMYWVPPANASFNEKIRFHANVRTSANETWRGLSSFEIVLKGKECVTGTGEGYRGTAHSTVTGIECQRWDSNKPHSHFTNPKRYPDADLSSNFCRNSDNDSWPWCYTTNPDKRKRFESCMIKLCDDDTPEFFYEFGASEGDQFLAENQTISQLVNFPRPIRMKAINLTSFQVHENGLVIFNNASHFDATRPVKFTSAVQSQPPMNDPTLIAPFWTKINRTRAGSGTSLTFYQQIDDRTFLERATADVKKLAAQAYNTNYSIDSFRAEIGLLVTWYLVHNNATESTADKGNTFQMLLLSDNQYSFLVFNYFMKSWSDGVPAQVGFDIGNGQHINVGMNNINLSTTLSDYVTERSNVGKAARWLLDVSPPCACAQGGHGNGHEGTRPSSPTTTTGPATTVADYCASSPCHNGARCQSLADRFLCTCVAGYTGATCSLDINDCIDEPCLNGGACLDEVNGYRCKCKDPYSGRRCEKRTGCGASTCQNNGECRNGTTCHCPPGFHGDMCQVSQCLDGSCVEPSTCFNVISGTWNCTCKGDMDYCPKVPPPTTASNVTVVACTSDRYETARSGYIIWKKTPADTEAVERCPTPSNQYATRKCNGSHGWEIPDMSNCSELSMMSLQFEKLFLSIITPENASSVVGQLMELTGVQPDTLSAYDVSNVASVLRRAVDVIVDVNRTSAGNVFDTVSNVLLSSNAVREMAGAETGSNVLLLSAIETTSTKLRPNGSQMVNVSSGSLDVTVADSTLVSSGLNFYHSSGKQSSLQRPNAIHASISLPRNLLTPDSNISNESNKTVQFVAYKNSKLFTFASTEEISRTFNLSSLIDLAVSNHVISASVGSASIQNLTEPVSITIAHRNNSKAYCVFWRPPKDEGDKEGYWSDEGCKISESTPTHTTCHCDHLTNFAMLLDIYDNQHDLSDLHTFALRVFTYVGCGVSILCLVLTIISYALFGKLRKDLPSKILMSLCVALILVNAFFLSLRIAYDNKQACVAVAAIVHYFLLSSLTWMGMEALNMYIALVRVFNTYYRRYMIKLSLAGWGIPLVFVGVAVGMHFLVEPSYVPKPQHHICWIRQNVFYGTLVAPFAVIFIFNTIIFFLVLGQLLGISSNRKLAKHDSRRVRRPTKRENARKLRGAIGLMALLGITWGIAFISIGEASLTLVYIFIALNSTQGLWVFIFHCCLKADICKGWKQAIRGKSFSDQRSKQWSRQGSALSSGTTKGSRYTPTASRTQSTASLKPLEPCEKTYSDFEAKPSESQEEKPTNNNLLKSTPENKIPQPEPTPVDVTRLVRRIPRPVVSPPSTSVAVQTDPSISTPKRRAQKALSTGMTYGDKYRIISLSNNDQNRRRSSPPAQPQEEQEEEESRHPPKEEGFRTKKLASSSSSSESGVYSDNASGKSESGSSSTSEDKVFDSAPDCESRKEEEATLEKCSGILDQTPTEKRDNSSMESSPFSAPKIDVGCETPPEEAESGWKPPLVIKRGDKPHTANLVSNNYNRRPWRLTSKLRTTSQPELGVKSATKSNSPPCRKRDALWVTKSVDDNGAVVDGEVGLTHLNGNDEIPMAALSDSIKMIKFRFNRGSFHDPCQ